LSAPLVSVLVTTYNHARFVEEALDSLRAQTARDFEVIITDDASPDGTADVVAAWLARTGYPARFIKNPVNRGICANRNAALARTSGRFVCSLSGDDAYQPDRIERQLECFLAQPEGVAVVYSDAVVVDAEGGELAPSYLARRPGGTPPPSGRVFKQLARACFLCAPAAMVRRSAIAAVGGYDESLSYEDYDMWLRLSHRYDFVHLPGRFVRYRELPTSLSNSARGQARLHASHTRIMSRWLDVELDAETRGMILDNLWTHAKVELWWRRDELARRAFAAAAAPDARLHRRLIARLVQLPGGCATVRSLGIAMQRLRRRPFPLWFPEPQDART
jgi:glycosyltransferase involved in cell wall biosynthesis